MIDFETYQQADTTQANRPLKLDLSPQNREIIPFQRTPININQFEQLDSLITNRPVIVEEPRPLTEAQLRYIWNRNEEKLLVDSSRYMKSSGELSLSTSFEHQEILLPVRSYNRINTDWLTILIILCGLLIASVRFPYAKYIKHLFQSTINYSTATRMLRESNSSLTHASFRLELLFYIVFSIFLYLFFIHIKPDLRISGYQLFLICGGFTIGYFLLKIVVYNFSGFIVQGVSEANEYLFNMKNYYRILALFLFPITVFITYSSFFNSEILLYIGLILVILFYLMSLQRGISILIKKQFSIFYLFLYLCILEILPLLFIYKKVME